jgi:PAS domain S-box-containing protein
VASSKVISAAGERALATDLSPDEAFGILRSLLANVPGAIYRVELDEGMSLRLIGDEIERITGYPPEDFVDAAERTLFSLVHREDRQWVEVELRAVRELEVGRTITVEYRLVRADGEIRWVLERGVTVRDQHGRLCLDGMIFDVTERRRAEERLRRQEAEAAQARELRASRARIVAAADEARRRLERDLHDGAQQRFVSAALMLQLALRRTGDPEVVELLGRVAGDLEAGLADLRELAHGIHPAVLTDRGLPAALDSLAARSAVPVIVDTALDGRIDPAVETALYFTAAEALTNVAKYANATEATVHLTADGEQVAIAIRDDGRGGASLEAGSGLRGLVDRLGALGGRLNVESPAGRGTTVRAVVPLAADAQAGAGSGRPGVAASSALRA